jgi:WD40 repeat protein
MFHGNGQSPSADRDQAVGSVERDGFGPRRAVRASALAGGGLGLGALAMIGLALLARDPGPDPAQEPPQARFQRMPSQLGSVAFAPDGKRLALGQADGGLLIQSLSGGRPKEFEHGPGLGMLPSGLAYSPDGRTLASGGHGPGVKLWDVATGAIKATLEGHWSPVGSLAFSRDGKTLASGSTDGDVRLWDVATGLERATLAGHSSEVRGLAFTPDGRQLASGSLDGSVLLWDVATGGEVARFQGGGRKVYALAFSPDGQRLAVGLGALVGGDRGEIGLWKLSGTQAGFRTIGPGIFRAVAFSPDGQTLAAGGNERVVRLWDVESGEELATLAGHEGFIASLAFSPDGESLATAGQDSLVGLFDLKPSIHRTTHHRL